MLNIKKYIKENVSILIVCVCFLFIALFNSFMNIGIIEDGSHHFWEALVADNIWTGHEGKQFSIFPFNSRYFPSLIQHLSVGIPVLFGIVNIKILLFMFTFISYLLPIIGLVIIYLNIPKYKKENFEIVLLYFLTCMNFLIYQIWTENFMTGIFLWIIFVIYYYVDFDKMSKFNLICLTLFSICLISSHPMTAVFVIPMIVFASIKQHLTKNIVVITNFSLILSYILLLISFIFNIYFIINPIFPTTDYLSFNFVTEPFKYFFISVLFILIISLININNRITKILSNIFYCLIFFVFLYFVLFKIESFSGCMYRVLGFYVPLFLMIFILFKDFFKLKMNYKNIKTINYMLIFIFLIHSVYYGVSWNNHLKYLKNIMITNKQIDFMDIPRYDLTHYYLYPIILCVIPVLFKFEPKCKILILINKREEFDYEQFLINIHKDQEKILSKFNITFDNFVVE